MEFIQLGTSFGNMTTDPAWRPPWIARIWHSLNVDASDAQGAPSNPEVVGAGFLIADRHVLTCAHVVNQALGRPIDEATIPDQSVFVDFPLAPSRSKVGKLLARVVSDGWVPEDPDGRGDIALLELAEAPTRGVQPPRLSILTAAWGHGVRALGFPTGHDQGEWARRVSS